MKKLYFLLVIAAVVFNSCSKHLDPVITPETLKGILLGKDTLHMFVGEVRQINFTVTPSDIDTASLKWDSSDPTVISVTNLGKISALKLGTSKISVSNQANTIAVSCEVTVIDPLAYGLIAYYPFNNSAIDSSGNGNNGTTYNATPTTNRFGTENSAYLFDGVSSYIDVKDNVPLRLNGTNYTINTWVKVAGYNSSYGSIIWSKRGLGSSNGWVGGIAGQLDIANGITPGAVTFNVSGGPDPYGFGNIVVTKNTWHMITISYNSATNKLSILIDGVLDTVTSNIPIPNSQTNTDLYFGTDSQSFLNGNLTNYYFFGSIDDIRIYKRLLTTSEINRLYNLTY